MVNTRSSSNKKQEETITSISNDTKSLREKCPNTEFFLVYSVSLRIQSECRKIRTRKNSVFGHFSRSECYFEKLIEPLVANKSFEDLFNKG